MAAVEALLKALLELRKAAVLLQKCGGAAESLISNTSVSYVAFMARSNAHVSCKGLKHWRKTLSVPTDSIKVQSASCDGAQVESFLSNS